jgi:hemoglobin-like flavoprotein
MLTTEDVALVRASYAMVAPMQDSVAELFYGRLFAIAPQLRALFPADLTEQKRKLMSMIGMAVSGLDDVAKLIPAVKGLGARHARYGATMEHYAIVGEALLWTLQQGLGDKFTPSVKSAWIEVYGILAMTMETGAVEAAALKTAA